MTKSAVQIIRNHAADCKGGMGLECFTFEVVHSNESLRKGKAPVYPQAAIPP